MPRLPLLRQPILGVTAGSGEATQVDSMIDSASRLALKVSMRSTLVSTSLTEYYDGDGTNLIHLRAWPITAVTSIHVDDSTPRDWATEDLIDTDYYLIYENDGKVVLDGYYFTQGNYNVKVIYTAGYATVPYDLQQAVEDLVIFWYQRQKEKRVGVRSFSVGDKSTSFETDIPKAVMSTFMRYRDHTRAMA
jgi:hypothetical protein